MKITDHEELSPGIFLYKNVFKNSEKFLSIAKNDDRWKSAKIFSENWEGVEDKEYRNNKTLTIGTEYKNPIEYFALAKIMWECGNDYATKFNFPFGAMESPQILHYKNGEGFYKPHFDASNNVDRVFSIVLYLNDVESGGETYFEHFKLGVSPIAGNAIVFPANYPYLHTAKKPKSADKYCAVTWFLAHDSKIIF